MVTRSDEATPSPAGVAPGPRAGVEIELLAPPGSSRRDLAEVLADRYDGTVETVFHEDSEPSLVPDMGVFRHLTQGFRVVDRAGATVCTLVDDVTIAAELPLDAPPVAGWWRLLTDDVRLLHLLARTCRPDAPIDEVLRPVAALFGTAVRPGRAGVHLVDDGHGATVAMAAPLRGARERTCEIVTPPLHPPYAGIRPLLAAARELGFTVPREAAVHVHLDAQPFRTPAACANVIRLFGHWRTQVWEAFGTNPGCRRLGPLPAEMVAFADSSGATGQSWSEFSAAAGALGHSRFSDVNLTRVLNGPFDVKDTLEVRVLPGSDDDAAVLEGIDLAVRLLEACRTGPPLGRPDEHEGRASLHAMGRASRPL